VITRLLERLPTYGLLPVHVRKESVGFIFNRIWDAIKRESLAVVAEGVSTPEVVDQLFQSIVGSNIGPFRLMDKVGLDVVLDIEEHYAAIRPGIPAEPRQLLKRNIELGRLGIKSGGGDVTTREIVESTKYARTGDVTRMSIPLLGYGLSDAWRRVTVDRTHDDLGRLRSLKIAEGQTAHYDAPTIAYNEWGFVKSLTRSDLAFSGGMSYNYDDRGRLRRFTVSGVPVTFGYDDAGNLTSQTALSVGPLSLPAFQGLTYDTDNRLIGWTYDAGGRLEADSKFNYKYNELDQIVDVREGDWVVAQYLYDADGYRVREVYDGRVVYSVRGLNHELLSQETQIVLYPGDTSFYFWPDGSVFPSVATSSITMACRWPR
jgi:YD repeat-containing protein